MEYIRQIRIFYNWACSQGNKPKFIDKLHDKAYYDNSFEESIKPLSPELKNALTAYRDSVIQLHEIGLSIDEVETYINQNDELDERLSLLKHNLSDLNKQYKDLIHLKQIISFTQDVNYVYGSHELKNEFKEFEKSKMDYNNIVSKIENDISNKKKDPEIEFDF